jgi:peptidoglycan/LPS O-acetylase OafA/YrhL
LQAILLVFLVVSILEKRGHLKRMRSWTAVLVTAAALPVAVRLGMPFLPDVFSLVGAIYLFPFFLLGLGIFRFADELERALATRVLVALLCVVVTVEQFAWWSPILTADVGKRTFIGMLSGAVWCLTVFRVRPSWKPLAWLGGYAFPIYLYQSFGAGIGRRVGADLVGHSYFLFVLVATLGFGVLCGAVMERIPYVRTITLGLRSGPGIRTSPVRAATQAQ